jgi:hypothetical protein
MGFIHNLHQQELKKISPGIRRAISVRRSVLINLQHSRLFSAPVAFRSFQIQSGKRKKRKFAGRQS